MFKFHHRKSFKLEKKTTGKEVMQFRRNPDCQKMFWKDDYPDGVEVDLVVEAFKSVYVLT